MHKTYMYGVRLIGLCGIAGLLAACSPTETEMQELESFDAEPIAIGMAQGSSLKAFKKQATTNEEASAIRKTKDTCNFRRPAGYYDQLEAQVNGQIKTVYTVTTADAAYDVTVLPNVAGYMTMNQFREDFGGCGASEVSPLRMTSDWLVLASSCADLGCSALKAQVDSTVTLK